MAQTSDFKRGQIAAQQHGHEPDWNADGESRQFWNGFRAVMREEENLHAPSQADFLD